VRQGRSSTKAGIGDVVLKVVEYLTLSRNDPVDNVTAQQQCDNLLRILIDLIPVYRNGQRF